MTGSLRVSRISCGQDVYFNCATRCYLVNLRPTPVLERVAYWYIRVQSIGSRYRGLKNRMPKTLDLSSPFRILPGFKERVWGVPDLKEWFATAPEGMIGEAWFTAGENETAAGAKLGDLLLENPEILGNAGISSHPGLCPLLVKFLVSKFASRTGRKIQAVGQATMARLTRYSWPGNVRELENVLERAVILSSGETLEIDPEMFAGGPSATAETTDSPPMGLETVERNHILSILKQTNWVIEGEQGAAKLLDLHPNTLRSRLKKMGINRASV